jgi:hypothetical protein
MGRRAFVPRRHPKAGLRKAREDARHAGFDHEQAMLRGERAEREREDDRRLRMMARLEPTRYLRLVDSGQVLPRYRDAALAELERASAGGSGGQSAMGGRAL